MGKRIVYNKYDAGKAFCWGIFAPQIIAFIYVFALSVISKSAGIAYEELIKNNIVLVVSMILTPIAFFSIFVFTNKTQNINWKESTGFSFKLNWVNVLLCVLISLICVFGFNDIVTLFDAVVSLTGFKGSYSFPIPLDNVGWLFLNLILLAALPAICEELLFRGVILNGLKQYSQKTAIIGSALLFALMHGGLEQTLYPILVGLVLGFVMVKTSNILYPIIIHFCNNAIVVIVNFIVTVTGGSALQEYEFTVLGVLLAVVYFIAAVASIYLIVKKLLVAKKHTISDFNTDVVVEEENSSRPNKLLIYGIIAGVILWVFDLFSGFGA